MAYKDIYDIPMQFDTLDQMLADEDIDQEEYSKLVDEIVNIVSTDGLDSARAFYLHLENRLAIIKSEKEKLDKIKKSTEKTIESIKDIFKLILSRNGDKKITTKNGYVSPRKSKSVEITDEKLLSDDFKTSEVVVKISKTKIKEAIESGIEVQGAEIVTNTSITVK